MKTCEDDYIREIFKWKMKKKKKRKRKICQNY